VVKICDWGEVLLLSADIRSVKNEREEHKDAACHSLVSISAAITLPSKLLKVLETSKYADQLVLLAKE
jgi:hypothetical protein